MTISIIRLATLLALSTFATLALFAEPAATAPWIISFLASKLAAALAALATIHLYRRWAKSDKLISAIHRLTELKEDTI